MAETKHQEEEPTLHPKRKPDLSREDNEDNPHKAQKLEPPPPPPDTNNDSSLPLHKNHHLEPSPLDSSIPEQNDAKFESNLLAEVEDDDDDEEEEEYEDEDEDEDDDDGDSENGDGEKAVVDRKGKGIMRDDKGKGKLIEEENDDDDDDDEDDDDSDSDIGSDVSDGESDLSDDPLAEVDLDNILPSRTRRRTVQPGIHIANDHRNHNKNLDDGDSGA